jgi:signal transduction histidine kinase
MTSHRPRILAIDDQPANLVALGAILAEEFALFFATSGPMGLAMALADPPELVLLDVMMPDMDGFETFRRFKAEPKLNKIPVIFVTALNDQTSEVIGLAMGASDYITKPIILEIAQHRIRNLLEREQLRKEVEEHRNHLEDLVFARTLDLSIAKEATDSAHRVKSNFLSRMSHELRTPLNAIIGMTELAMLQTANAQQGEQLGRVLNASDDMLALVSQLIDITEIQSKRLTLDSSHFKLRSALNCVTRLLSQDATNKGLALRVTTSSELDELTLWGDRLRLGQILKSLTTNAISFTSLGYVNVSVQPIEATATDIVLRFEVKDTGIGIAPENQKRIFDVFEQVDVSTQRAHSGAGLGLALCKQLVELMGGTVGLQSQLGVGSTFWFTVRMSLVDNTAP